MVESHVVASTAGNVRRLWHAVAHTIEAATAGGLRCSTLIKWRPRTVISGVSFAWLVVLVLNVWNQSSPSLLRAMSRGRGFGWHDPAYWSGAHCERISSV